MEARTWQAIWDRWDEASFRDARLGEWASRQSSFIGGLLPERACRMSVETVLDLLRRRWGDGVDLALSPELVDAPEGDWPAVFRGPRAGEPDGRWLRSADLVGVNVRALGSFWALVPYSLTLPAHQDCIHLLPFCEPGVVGSLYGQASWNVDRAYVHADLARLFPHLDDGERQLAAVVRLLHLTGRSVGMDVVPHTDRYSEIALARPALFEWLLREDATLVDHAAELHLEVEERVFAWLRRSGPAVAGDVLPPTAASFFAESRGDEERARLLFGRPEDPEGRHLRRVALVSHLHRLGYEPVPATMAPPYRGMVVDTRDEARRVDGRGMVWREFRIERPEAMSRVFGPLTRYKLYERLDDNRRWEIDFSRPRPFVWAHLCEHVARLRERLGFDFMRGDMAHVQMRPGGVPAEVDGHYDPHAAVLRRCREDAPHFASYAESFLAPPGTMSYGDEVDHLDACGADAALGDLQSCAVGSAEFLQKLRRYADLTATRGFAAGLTMFTGDKDDPRFDPFFRHGALLRYFLGVGVGDAPSYMGAGFECRDLHLEAAPNEHYSKYYVFEERKGPKATAGPWVWGRNGVLFAALSRLRSFFEREGTAWRGRPTRWLLPPDATGHWPVVAWTQDDDPTWIFMANFAPDRPSGAFSLPALPGGATWTLVHAGDPGAPAPRDRRLRPRGRRMAVAGLEAGECRVYRREDGTDPAREDGTDPAREDGTDPAREDGTDSAREGDHRDG